MAPRGFGRLGPRSLIACAALASALLVAILIAPTASGAPKKLYGADLSPHAVSPSSTTPYTFTLTNESKSQMIGAANLTAASGFTIPPGQVLSVSPRGTATVVGDTVELRDLELMPDETASTTFMATSASGPGVYTWLLDARQANDFRGSGNSFAPGPNVDLTTTVGFITTVVACDADESCSGTATDGTTTADVFVDPGASAAVLTITLLPTDAISCEGYTGTSATVDFNVTADDRTKTVTIMLDATLVADRDADEFEVCYSSPTNGFVDQDGNEVPAGGSGLLPDCDIEIAFPPCVSDRTDIEGGSVSVSFFAPEGDPKGHI